MPRGLWLNVGIWLVWTTCACAQSQKSPPQGDGLDETGVQRWRIGMIVSADGAGFRGIVGTVAVPAEWPEQRVRVVAEDLSPGVSVSYRSIEDTARQMVIRIPSLAAGEQAKAVVTFETRRALLAAPEETARLVAPDRKRLDRRLAAYLAPSPFIESNHPEIKRLAEEIAADKQTAWERVEAIYDWVRSKIEYKEEKDRPPRGAVATLDDGTGACGEMTSLFIALCRAAGIPARTVRVPGHCYPEFYLVDADGRGHWFPCQASGTRAFGRMPDPRPILQKGENVAGAAPKTGKKDRFLRESLVGKPTGRGGSLKVQLVCEQVKEEDK